MAALRGRAGCGQGRWAARLTPNLLILRRTRRGLERSRRAGSRGVQEFAGGPAQGLGQVDCAVDAGAHAAPGGVQCSGKGDPVGVEVAVAGGGVDQCPDRIVDAQVAPSLLVDPAWGA